MKINICYLYYDLLNLYGESGNILALCNYFERQGIKVNVSKFSINNEINLDNVNLVYIGSGTESNQLLALEHLMKYKDVLKNYIDNNGYVIATGNSFELFGKSFYNDRIVNGLDIFDFNAYKVDNRIVNEGIYHCDLINCDILGFQNHNNLIDFGDNYLFESVKLKGLLVNGDGIKFNNFYGTYLIGPLLVRNFKLLQYICNDVIKSINKNFKFKKTNFMFSDEAFKEFVNNYYKN